MEVIEQVKNETDTGGRDGGSSTDAAISIEEMTQLQLQMGQIEELGPSGPSYKLQTICQSRVDPDIT